MAKMKWFERAKGVLGKKHAEMWMGKFLDNFDEVLKKHDVKCVIYEGEAKFIIRYGDDKILTFPVTTYNMCPYCFEYHIADICPVCGGEEKNES